jgi:histidine triad (HIT) family protein
MTECPFCKIREGQLPASVVHQDPICTAFLDVQPINPGHVLIIPNEHVESFIELSSGTRDHLFQLSQTISEALRKSGIKSPGVNLFLADGKEAMQEVPHFHIHIIPRFEGDGFEFNFSPTYFELPTRDELEKNAEHIRQALHEMGNTASSE